ncbi:ubiquitin family domain-containing protein [Ditylenchus destructor]|nr:ubiquitin family domain-containing protein [Ditylenchus destructor]
MDDNSETEADREIEVIDVSDNDNDLDEDISESSGQYSDLDFNDSDMMEIATTVLRKNNDNEKFVVTRPESNECLVLDPATQTCETEILERIFMRWGIENGTIAAEYHDLTDPLCDKKRLDSIKMSEHMLICKVPITPVPVMVTSKPESDCGMDICLWWTIYQLKEEICKQFGTPVPQQSLFLKKEQMEDEASVASYSINVGSNIELIIFECGKEVTATTSLFSDPNFFAHEYNVDYSKMVNDEKPLTRGGRPYKRPFGCFRYGVQVLGKYQPDDRWVGPPNGMRDVSPPDSGEWPVAYHGTKEISAASILQEGFKLEKCVAFAYGKGIYCSPDPKTALTYSMSKGGFEFKGKRYLLVIQIRVDPEKLKVVKPNGGVGGLDGEYWLLPDGTSIRPYGICVFPYPENGRVP